MSRKAYHMSESIIDYVTTELRTFAEHPFHEVDSLVLSQFSYICLGSLIAPPSAGVPQHPLTIQKLYRAECFPEFFAGQSDAVRNRQLLCACAASPRFRDIGVACYDEQFDPASEKQFCAMTFFLGDGRAYLAFRGTDSTLVGWKEDFNMAFLTPVPSQEAACTYTRAVAEHVHGQLILGGHSKGGNLAVYAAMTSPAALQNRITDIYSHDGPGFKDNNFESDAFVRIRDRIPKTLPQSSLVGMLLQHQENYSVVESGGVGILQHNPYSWIVRDGSFVKLSALTTGADYLNRTLSDWLAGLSADEREQFVDALYSAVSAANITSFTELRGNWTDELPRLMDHVKSMDETSRRILQQTLKSLFVMAWKNLPSPADDRMGMHALPGRDRTERA